MPINNLPTPPSRSDPTNFATRGDAFMAALPAFVTQANETAAAMNLNSTTDTSVTSTLIGLGAKTFTVSAAKSFQPGMWLVVANTAAPSTNAMYGTITSYSGTTLVMNIVGFIGSGTLAAWTISQSAPGATGALTSNTPAGNIAATTMQGAINELDAEKALLAGSTSQDFSAATINAVLPLHLNDIINGDFKIAQIGTSFAAPVSAAYDLDGWLNVNTSTAVFTVAQVAGSTAGRLARQVTITTADAAVAAGDLVTDETRIEGSNIEKYVGQTFTVAFRARVPVAGIHCVAVRNGTDRSYVVEINFPTANVFQNCSFTVVGGLPTAGTWNYTNGTGLDITFAHMVGTTFQTTPNAWQVGNFVATANQVNDCATVSNLWAMEKVTMNLGTVAAVSEISVEAELIRCQRYCRPLPILNLDFNASGASVFGCVVIAFGSDMRATPTMSAVATASGGAANNAAQVFVDITPQGCSFRVTSTAAGRTYYLQSIGNFAFARL